MKRAALLISFAVYGLAPLRAQTAPETQTSQRTQSSPPEGPAAGPALASTPAEKLAAATALQDRPIPDVATLMHQVEANQEHIDKIRKNYRYRALTIDEDLNSDGSVKKTETEEREVFYVNGHTIGRLLKKDGKELTGKEQQKEKEQIDKEIAKAQAAKRGDEKDSNGNAILSVSRLLQLGTVTAPRRMIINGRSALVFDFVGNTKAKTGNMSEGVMKDLTGTVWIDEADRQVIRMEARFEQNFHVAGGLLINIQKGTNFIFKQALVNNEVWLPTSVEGKGSARVLLLKSFNGHMRTTYSDYRKYVSDVKVLPGATPVAADSAPDVSQPAAPHP